MKELLLNKTGGYPATQESLDFVQQGLKEALAQLGYGLGFGDTNNMVVLWGCVAANMASQVFVSQGAIFVGGEIYPVDMHSVPGANIASPLYAHIIDDSDPTLDPTTFESGATYSVHRRKHIRFSTAPQSGLPGSSSYYLLSADKRLNARIQRAAMPIGAIVEYAGATAPDGWAFCNGQSLSVVADSRLQTLYALIGTTYGGTGSTNFLLPDFRDRAIVGSGGAYSRGQKFGGDSLTLTMSHIPAHTHTGTTSSSGSHTHGLQLFDAGTGSITGAANAKGAQNGNAITGNTGSHTHTFTTNSSGSATPTAIDLRQKSMAIPIMIRLY